MHINCACVNKYLWSNNIPLRKICKHVCLLDPPRDNTWLEANLLSHYILCYNARVPISTYYPHSIIANDIKYIE